MAEEQKKKLVFGETTPEEAAQMAAAAAAAEDEQAEAVTVLPLRKVELLDAFGQLYFLGTEAARVAWFEGLDMAEQAFVRRFFKDYWRATVNNTFDEQRDREIIRLGTKAYDSARGVEVVGEK